MSVLGSDLRGLLERTVVQARAVAEQAAEDAVHRLAVAQAEAFPGMSPAERALRSTLRARARALGEGSLTQGVAPLVEEIAYEQWHRMLFARFLAENNLLMHPTGVPVSLQDCAELAAEEGEPDAWAVAARYASGMLPGIFRAGDPAARVRFAPEGRIALERLLADLPVAVFTADDALGWVYQFWQSKKKEEVNRSEVKIGAGELPAVTQLFTEDYMVRFLLENSLGAWWAARHPASPLLRQFDYLRFRDDGAPAAGTFPNWPARAAEVTVMDPCCGSGHFLVSAFGMLRQMRMEEEGLPGAQAGEAVLRDNLFGLELDPRCTQLAAFALAFAAWKADGYRSLPLPNIACSGLPVQGQLSEWKKLAGKDYALTSALERLHHLFRQAPTLGSLIDPNAIPIQDRMFTADFAEIEPLLTAALARERAAADPAAAVFGETATGVARAARFLAGTYTLVATNVPYLARGKQDEALRTYCDRHHPEAKADLATAFVERCRAFAEDQGSGSYAVVTPQNWLFLTSYTKLREKLLREQAWEHVSRLGVGAFETISGEVVNVALLILTNRWPTAEQEMTGIDASEPRTAEEKAEMLRESPLQVVAQAGLLENPDARITLELLGGGPRLEQYAVALAGIMNGDSPRFQRFFWEITCLGELWVFQQSTVEETKYYSGRERVILFDEEGGHLREEAWIRRERLHDSDRRGNQAWGKSGIVVSQMGYFPATLYTGEKFDSNAAVILPNSVDYIPAIWAFCSSPEFNEAVRRIDQSLKVTNAALVKVPFDLERWQKVADEQYPDGLPEPYSNDPTQWLFAGDPVGSTDPLHVAVGRLLGYRWPEQEPDRLDACADRDGIVCLPAVGGERPAAERLRALLAAAYGDDWSVARQDALLAEAGYAGKSLDEWLRDGFFAQHCRLFKNRPFIWHIWDGRRDGFSALVNYHKLDAELLNRLTYTYLGDWINRQRAARDAGEPGAEARLIAAQALQAQLRLIAEGQPPYDIYVRWKPAHEQPIGWHPDLSDGVRLNIRPFVTAGILRARFTINWNKDRGKNPDGSVRLNDLHLTHAEKQAARAAAAEQSAAR